MHNYKPTKRLHKYKAIQDFFNQCTMGYYSVNPMESFLQLKKVKPKGFTKGSGYISLYFPTHVTMQIFKIALLERGVDKKK